MYVEAIGSDRRRVLPTRGAATRTPLGYACRKPVLAAINGAAVGIGATMTLAMDARLKSTKARFGPAFGKLDITPESCSTWLLPRIVGMPTALDLGYRSDILTVDAARELGLAQALHEPGALITEARALADAWTHDRSPISVALMRQTLYRNSAQPHPIDAHRIDSLAMFYTSIGDGHNGVRAFLDKRAREFSCRASEMPLFYQEWVEGEYRRARWQSPARCSGSGRSLGLQRSGKTTS